MFDKLKRMTRFRDVTKVAPFNCPQDVEIRLMTPAGPIGGNFRTTREVYQAIDDYMAMCARTKKQKRKMTGPRDFHMRLSYTLFFRNKPLSRNDTPLDAYGAILMELELQWYGMVGGSKTTPTFPIYTHIAECEQEVIETEKIRRWVVQSLDATAYHFGHAGRWLGNKLANSSWDGDYINKLIEDVIFLVKMLTKSKSADDYLFALLTFCKFQTPDVKVLSSKFYERLVTFFKSLFSAFELQSVEDTFATCKDFLGKYEEIKNAPIFKKVYKFAMYALSLSLFDKVGLTFDRFNYSKIEAEAIRRKYHKGPDFLHCMLDTLLFLCERGYQCLRTGSLDPLYHSGSTYEKWFDQAVEIKIRFRVLQSGTNPHERFEILADLRDLIEKGEAIKKHAVRVGKQETRMVSGMVHDLQMLLAEETTKRAAQQERKSPFSVLLYGGSSIGKSTLTKMLFYQYGKTFNLPLGSEFKFTRNANANFWDGFNSSQWCVQLDDIAFMHPSKASTGDPTIMEMLQVVNNVPFVPDQASLDDKGRTPMRAEFVIATSNCEHLNAFHYFQTPLAVQRRLPFVIDVKPKPEYTKDGCMLDSSVVQMVDGEWPDYWIYEIKRVVPVGQDRDRQQGTLETIHIFDNVDMFLSWFSKVAVEHANVQKKVDLCDVSMKSIEICHGCYKNMTKCDCMPIIEEDMALQARNYYGPLCATRGAYFLDLIKYAICVIITKILSIHRISGALAYLFKMDMTRDAILREYIPDKVALDACRDQMRWLGEKVQNNIGYSPMLINIAASLATMYGLKKAYDFLSGESFISQALTSETGKAPVPRGDEKQNVWFKDDFALSTFDVSSRTLSWKEMDFTKVQQAVGRNCISLRSFGFAPPNKDGQPVQRRVKAFGVCGHIYVTNNHGLPDNGNFKMDVVVAPFQEGINSNLTMLVTQRDIYRIPEMDVAFIRIRNLAPVKNLLDLFPKHNIGGIFKGSYIARTESGAITTNELQRIKRRTTPSVVGINLPDELWGAFCSKTTVNGDCGSIMLAQTPYGPVILGFHVLGSSTEVCSLPLTNEIVQKGLNHFAEPHIQSNTPNLKVEGFETPLTSLHPKSVARYIDDGTAQVYGSFGGFKQAPKSHVKPTLISECVQATCKIPLKHTKPMMSGYQPWRTAALDMVKPVMDIDTDVLGKCVEAYTQDILAGLSSDDLAEIMVYDNATAINGAAGVQYVDKMNRNTSAGFPFNKGKKNFLEVLPGPSGTEWVQPTPQIMEMLEEIHTAYVNGERAAPIFNAHLKDEAVTHKKAAIGKTRVFTGAPFAWSIENRKYLLSVTRVLQRNKYVWEGMPGMNAMSREWETLYRYLTKFGTDRIIAGDYAAFDKTMPPCVILAAFDVLSNICKAAGYTEEDLRVVQGLAEDTAFPIVAFNGDLMSFNGSNPSGHPLTVIINGLANALYMRMCYYLLNPEKEVTSFKKNVALATYGDDNIMGVSVRTPWFNHTAIQNTLKNLGIRYTMADKEAESVPYITIEESSFLKRSFRFEKDVGMHVCPLEEDSIWKSLTIGVVSDTLCPEAQSAEVFKNALREFFFHGRDVFERRSAELISVMHTAGLTNYVDWTTDVPSWNDLVTKWKEDNDA